MEYACLYDYISNYDNVPLIKKQNPDVIPLKNHAGFIKRRSNPSLISHMQYDKLTKPEDYYRNLLLLFKPWREKIEVLVPYQSYSASFDEEIKTNEKLKNYESKISIHVKKRAMHEEKVRECVSHLVDDDIDAPETIECSEAVVKKVQEEFIQTCQPDSSSCKEMFESLNKDQRRVFFNVISTLHKQYADTKVPQFVFPFINVSASNENLHMFCSGVGGTGKSYLIHAIKSYVTEIFDKPVAIMAPTGIAAASINGMTVHRLLHMPVQLRQTTQL